MKSWRSKIWRHFYFFVQFSFGIHGVVVRYDLERLLLHLVVFAKGVSSRRLMWRYNEANKQRDTVANPFNKCPIIYLSCNHQTNYS